MFTIDFFIIVFFKIQRRETDRQTDRQTDKDTDRQRDRGHRDRESLLFASLKNHRLFGD